MARYVTLVNRSSKNLTGVWDGKHHTIFPGKNSFPEHMAEKFKQQNPLMGSEDPRTLQITYLLGIEEQGDPTDALEQSDAIEKWDRSKMPNAKQVEIVPGVTGLYSRASLGSATLPLDPGFVAPDK